MAGLTPAIVDAQSQPDFETELEARLLTSLRADSEQASNEPVRLAIPTKDGAVLAGLSGRTSYGWLHVDMLWVAPEHRRRGYGRQLVDAALERALSLGCHSAWLDTSSPVACEIWKRLGFSEFGRLENALHQHPAGHRRWFLQKCPIL